jgi:CheY-like chemotaxis protein
VIDNGIGIAEKELLRLFQPFTQVDSSLNRRYEGTGLGLALVQKLTDLHGGSVQVESDGIPGKGSRFTINLPCLSSQVKQADVVDFRSPGKPPLEQPEKTLVPPEASNRGVILLAEDNMPNVLTISEYLESYGYEIIVAHDGLEAIAKAEQVNPDLILMDIQMPAMDGLEATRRLRSNPRFASTPIIALTALAMPGDRERCLEAGATEYMSKPVSLKGLVNTIMKLHKAS